MAERRLVVRLDLGTPRLGAWCDTCLASSGYDVDLLQLTQHGVNVVGTFGRCIDCRAPLGKIQRPPR